MNALKILLVAVGCLILGIIGGFAGGGWLGGTILTVFVFVGWILWRLFKSQSNDNDKNEK